MKDNNNFERVMAAVEELNGIRWGYVSTENFISLRAIRADRGISGKR